MTVTDRILQRAAAVALNISWTSFPFQFSPPFFISLWHVQHSSSEKKLHFLSIPSLRIAGVRRYRQKSERSGKRKWSERKKALRGLEKGGIDGRWAAKVRQQQPSHTWEINLTFHPELPSFLFCTPSHIVAVLSCLCKVCLLKRRHWTPGETKTKRGAVVMSGKRQKMVCKIERPLKKSRTKKGENDFSVSIPLHGGHFIIVSPVISCHQTWKVSITVPLSN